MPKNAKYNVIKKHVKLKQSKGYDASTSITTEELALWFLRLRF